MTEEIIQNQELDKKASDEAQALKRKDRVIRRAFGIGLLFLSVSIVSDILNLIEFRVWQIPAESLGDIASLVLLSLSYIYYRREDRERAQNLLPIVILLTYTTGELFLTGSLIYNLISGLLLFGVTFFIFEPEDNRRWLQFAIIHSVLILLLGSIPIFPKFHLEQGTTNFVITSGITLLLLWQLVRRFQLRSIQIRLLLILLGVGLTPVLVSGLASTLIDLQRDTTQAETNLSAISRLNENQINSWSNTIHNDLLSLQQNEVFTDNFEFLTQFSPTEAFRQQILDSMLTDLQNVDNSNQNFFFLSATSPDGEILVSTNLNIVGESVNNHQGFDPGMEDLTFSVPVIDAVDPQARTEAFFPIFNDQGVLLGFITGSITMGQIEASLIDALPQLGETGEAYLVNDQNQLLTPLRDSIEFFPGTVLQIADPMEELAETSPDEIPVQVYENYAGESVLGTHIELPGLNSTLIVEQSQQEAFASLRISLIVNVVIALITLILSISLAVVVSRNFTAPIEDISETARKVLRGDQATFPEVDRVDEIGTLTNTLSEMTNQLLRTTVNLEQTVSERTAVLERRANYLETTSQISRATTGIYELNALLNTVAQLISENLGFYHVGIFINDDRDEYSVLRASNSEGGWKMLARGHKLEIGAQGIVGYVTGSGEARVQQQVVGDDSVYFDNPDLPLTRSEMALPLKSGNQIFGALDVQSEGEEAFSDEDVAVLQTLADAVTVTIQNTRLVEQLRENLESERRLFGEITKETWAAMLSRDRQGFSVRSDAAGTQMVTTPSTETGRMAMEEQMLIIGNLDEEINAYPAALPVTVRGGATIGVIETQKPEAEGPWTQEEISILENVSSELGLALDNARLFEETQRRAQRDRIAAELSTKIWASSDMDNILQTAVRELGSALNVSQGQIKLSLADDVPGETMENITDGENQS